MLSALMGILPSIGSFLSGGAGSTSTQDQSYESTTKGTSNINRTELSPKVLKALESLFTKGQLQSAQKTSTDSITGQLTKVNEDAANPFDVKAFVDGIMAGARNTMSNEVSRNINSASSDIGGTQGDNSMAALLGAKMRTDAAAQLASTEAEATARGTEIANQGNQLATESIVGLTTALNSQLMQSLQLLRGAKTKQKQKTKETTVGSGTSTTSSPFNLMSGLGAGLSTLGKPPE